MSAVPENDPVNDRGSTTEPNTPDSDRDAALATPQHTFARLIPTNRPACSAIERTVARCSSYHASFLGETVFRGRRTPCFELSLHVLPQFPGVGWRIGRGRDQLPNRGVDLLLCDTTKADDVAGIHARLSWVKGAAGFFLIADNARGKRCTLNGDDFTNDRRSVPFRSTITLGECAFTLQYVVRNVHEEHRFQIELKTFYAMALADDNPFILPTPREVDSRFGDWVVQYPISKGSYGTVFMVTHAATGRLAAAKQLVKTRYNATKVEHEIEMAKLISKHSHPSIASPFDFRHNSCRSPAEIARIRALIGDEWDPRVEGDITDEYIIFSPLLNATFRSLIHSALPTSRFEAFFSKLLDGVAFLHDHGLCHRDIKPVNILIRSYDPPEALLCDFGCLSNKSDILYDAPGTIPYLAPEQKPGLMHGPTVDYWACGLVGYELLTREVTVSRVDVGILLTTYYQRLDSIGSVMAQCCRMMLDANPTMRMPAKDALEALMSTLATGEEAHVEDSFPLCSTKKMKMG